MKWLRWIGEFSTFKQYYILFHLAGTQVVSLFEATHLTGRGRAQAGNWERRNIYHQLSQNSTTDLMPSSSQKTFYCQMMIRKILRQPNRSSTERSKQTPTSHWINFENIWPHCDVLILPSTFLSPFGDVQKEKYEHAFVLFPYLVFGPFNLLMKMTIFRTSN